MQELCGEPALRLTIDTTRPVRVRDAARILERLDDLFAVLPRDTYIYSTAHYELRLAHLHSGSLIADMVGFAGGFVTLTEFWTAASQLIERLRLALAIMERKSKRDLYKPERDVLASMSTVILHDNAQQINLQITGDNANVLVIDRSAAKAIDRFVSRTNTQVRKDDPPSPLYLRDLSAPKDIEEFNRVASRGVRGAAVRRRGGWDVHWPVWYGEYWPMRLSAAKDITASLVDGATYVFTGQAKGGARGLVFKANTADYWDEAAIT